MWDQLLAMTKDENLSESLEDATNSWEVAALIVTSDIGGADVFFYAPMRGILHIHEAFIEVGELVGVDGSMGFIHLFNFDTYGRVMLWDPGGGMLSLHEDKQFREGRIVMPPLLIPFPRLAHVKEKQVGQTIKHLYFFLGQP